jgi:pimeloyl-ACP methyl ester carboxylesterase
VSPSDLPLPARRQEVTDVIFVIHGIRDLGYWTHKIARRVLALGKTANRVFESETSSYGYFPMLSFLLPGRRRAKVEWLMDQYAEAKALYPNAKFSYVGHSNGTYLVAKALHDYPCCRFHRLVFAGSVVNTGYDWLPLLQSGRVEAVMNYVATSDWVVAILPKAVQMLGLPDLGSAGHDGFSSANGGKLYNIRYVRGSHSAALAEENWDAIAQFVVNGDPPPQPPFRAQHPMIVAVGRVAPVIWLAVIGLLILIGSSILDANWPEWWKTTVLVTYLYGIFKVLTKL